VTRHAAHCEFFASGAVTLLRLQGVPARYATGYRVVEQEEGEPYWAARNRDAHAWAEAYDNDQQKWVIVEATPGFTDPAYEELQTEDEEAVGAGGGRLALTAEQARSIVQWWYTRPLWQKSLLALVAITALGLPILLSRRRAWRRAQLARDGDPRITRWRSRLRVVDRRLRRYGFVRHPAETLHQFARRVETAAAPQASWLQANAQWYFDYANTRFQQQSTSPPPLPPRPPRRFLQKRD
jgi:hypothetical protein